MRGSSVSWQVSLVLRFKRAKTAANGRVGLEFSHQGIALAQVCRPEGLPPQLATCIYREAPAAQRASVLREMVHELGLGGLPANLVLHSGDYRTFLLEAPDVPADELRDAMRWRVKDMLGEPLDEVVLDCFALPADAYRGRMRMAYCAVLGKAHMNQCAAWLRDSGLRLQSIDIAEMAYRNIGLLAGAPDLNIAVLRLRTTESMICIQKGADLYMARRLEQSARGGADDLARMTLEIQRSLDYFESQIGAGRLNRILLLPMKHQAAEASAELAAGLATPLQVLDLRDLFPGQPAAELTDLQQVQCLGAIGAALRQERA